MSDHKKKGDHSAANAPSGNGADKQKNDGGESRTGHKQSGGHGGHK